MAGIRFFLLGCWRRLPQAVRRKAHLSAHWLSRRSIPLRVALNWKRGAAGGAPVSVVGLLRSTSGIGQGARLFLGALGPLAGRPVDVTRRLGVKDNFDWLPPEQPPAEAATVLTHLNPPELLRWLQAGGAAQLRGRRHIGYWAWELMVAPPQWREAFAYVDEVWAPSRFTADAIAAIAPADVPVRVVGHPVFVMPCAAPDRARFGLPEDRVLIFMALDLRSTIARKNPLDGARAFFAAASEAPGQACLVCKASNLDADGEAAAALRAELQGRPDVVLIEEALDAEGMSALLASIDIVLSLHRAEGFGLVLAEAMWLGKCVVATAWSGNMDFMDEESSVLVPYRLEAVSDAQGMYRRSEWAAPDVSVAAVRLKELISRADLRDSLAARGRRRAKEVFDQDRWLARVEDLLAASDARARNGRDAVD
ncbi:glycosyltransferase family 4 protein [Caulobacter hibisci]|uniref:Glycosyltransferase family 4 protein n=1 Tax=Caulobacter hibisci TaxID=2035993 RepID=A0ABS0SUJ2_9CAUL|nr:glycosyltransferase family 4 protein [Caulobacter hibisci]MBI1683284.1 glycosyltransferase family 4 protein [Caulobacter hibisci]